MLYPQKKERSHRFMLALRIGLPLFLLTIILIFACFSDCFQDISISFFVFAILTLLISVHFIFYMIHRGFDEQITDPITHTFTRQKIMSILQKDLVEHKDYSIILISVENLADINSSYGIKTGDEILKTIINNIGSFFKQKGFNNFPIGHFRGGHFLIGLEGNYNTIKPFLEMICLKFDDFVLNNIEIKIRGSMVDKSLGSDVIALTERVFELKEAEVADEEFVKSPSKDDISLLELDKNIIYAIENQTFSLKFQPVQADEKIAQVSIKLKGKNEKIIHQKTFMPVIKRLGYEKEYDEIVLNKVLQVCRKNKNISFAFRLSPSVLRNRYFFIKFKQMVENENIDFSRLIIILSEKEVYANIKKYNNILQEYRKLGIRFALDGVGSLNASVEYIKRLEVDIIRFDKPFSKYINSHAYRSILHSYVQMGKNMNMKSWIKMVDNEDAKKYFEDIKIDYIQGNIVSKIIDFKELKDIL